MKIKFLIMLILTFCLLLTGCGGFFAEETVEISSIDTITLDDGSTQITINYVDPEMKPTTFIIPKGEAGKTGNGIKNITYNQSDDGERTVVTIEFTDETVEPKVIAIPNGKSIASIVTDVDPETQDTLLTLVYSDGSIEEPIVIPPGVKGEDGIGIEDIIWKKNEDNTVTVTMVLTNGAEFDVEIPAPINGKDGVDGLTIVAIDLIPNGNYYQVKIDYNDGTSVTCDTTVTRPNQWYTDFRKPDNELDGIDGDLWYDEAHQKVYKKENGSWRIVMDFGIAEPEKITIKFNLNDTEEEEASLHGKLSYDVPKGQYFAVTIYKELPVAYRSGYKFLGWCTSPEWNPTNGYFNNFTYVYTELTLYAHWEKIIEE